MEKIRKSFSKSWGKSSQPRKQRKYRYNAPLHLRRKMLSAHLDKKLREDLGRRSATVIKGDEVAIMRGEFRKKGGKVSKVDMKSLKIYVENIKTKKVSGQEVQVPIDPINVKITKLNLDDKLRKESLMKGHQEKNESTNNKR